MNSNYLPTKTNLIKLQESLRITKQGHELLERKRMILTKELEKYLKRHEEVKKNVQDIVESGKILIRNANIDLGIDNLTNIVKKMNETHKMRYWFSPEIKYFLEQAGFELLACLDCKTLSAVSFDSWTAYFIARKC